MSRLRILALASDANPNNLATSLVGYSHAAALARQHTVTLVVRRENEMAVRTAGAPFHRIVAIRVPWLDELYTWSLRRIFKYDYGSHLLTAFNYPFTVAFEWCAWRTLRRRIFDREFDVAIRLLPVTSVLPGAFAFFSRKSSVPLVVGPINGGLPWPHGFTQAERQREWVTGLRSLYRVLPFSRSMYRHATAIIAGSSHTFAEFEGYRDKLFFVPENGIHHSQLLASARPPRNGPLRLIFVGRLVPYKACDLALRGAAPLLRQGRAHLTIAGDGPDRTALEELARSLGIERSVRFAGWLTHAQVLEQLHAADILVFPSIREFGGGVVFEALAAGVVPVVAAFGGPGDIVIPAVGYTVPLTTPDEMVSQIQCILRELDVDDARLRRLSDEAVRYAREQLTWEGKAQAVSRILAWAARRGAKPDLPPPALVRDTVTQ
jgi:glycosyltransferase involved in cell wall biosynthesis